MARIRLAAPDRPDAAFDASPVVSVLVSAQRAGAALRHDCGGKALCGTCRVVVEAGRASPVAERESARLSALGAGSAERLACQMRPGTDMVLRALLPLAPGTVHD